MSDARRVVVTCVSDPVVAAARRWWRGFRPIGWSEDDHLKMPTINAGARGKALARAVAKYVRKAQR